MERNIIDLSSYVGLITQAYESHGKQKGRLLKNIYIEQNSYITNSGETKQFLEVFQNWLNSRLNCLLVLADYGTGKTSMTLRYSAMLAKFFLKKQERLPIFISLRGVGRIKNIEEFIFKHTKKYSSDNLTIQGLRYLLETKSLVIFLDGLDEMGIMFPGGATINHIINLSDFIQKYPQIKIVITARTHYFRDEKEIDNLWGERIEIASQLGTQKLTIKKDFTCCYILPFNEKQKHEFLKKARPKDADALFKSFRYQQELWDLASRPILFEMILESIDDVGGKLDWDNQTALYKHYTNKWLMRDEYRGIMPIKLKRALTESLARKLWSAEADSIHWKEITSFLSKASIDIQLPHNIEMISSEMRTASFLVSGQEGFFSFAHPSFLEFFLASYILNNIEVGGMTVLEEKRLSNLTIQFFSDMLKEADPITLDKLNNTYLLAYKNKNISLLTNLTYIYANLGIPRIVDDIAKILAQKQTQRYIQTSLHSAFSYLLLCCAQQQDFRLPKYKIIHVDRIRNPITDEIIAKKGSTVILESLIKCAKLGLDCIRIKVLDK